MEVIDQAFRMIFSNTVHELVAERRGFIVEKLHKFARLHYDMAIKELDKERDYWRDDHYYAFRKVLQEMSTKRLAIINLANRIRASREEDPIILTDRLVAVANNLVRTGLGCQPLGRSYINAVEALYNTMRSLAGMALGVLILLVLCFTLAVVKSKYRLYSDNVFLGGAEKLRAPNKVEMKVSTTNDSV